MILAEFILGSFKEPYFYVGMIACYFIMLRIIERLPTLAVFFMPFIPPSTSPFSPHLNGIFFLPYLIGSVCARALFLPIFAYIVLYILYLYYLYI